MQLFCFTYAGGTGAFFNKLGLELIQKIQIFKPDYAGHGARHKEPFYKDFRELAEDLYGYLKSNRQNDEDYALFGYSMGSISTVEVLRLILERKEICPPKHVFLAAHEPETKRELIGYSSSEMEELVKARTIKFGGVPKNLENNKAFWRMYLPIYSADYTLIGGYDFDTITLETRIPLTVFYSETDTPLSKMENWKKYFKGDCNFIRYNGNHFFINDHFIEMARIIGESFLNMKD